MSNQREQTLDRLARDAFDVLIIGGGATGAGCALDAVSRGLSVALVDRVDFTAGTSSRSTKLIHGGVRYLEQAVKKLDREQYQLVRDALHERATLLKIAPHLTRALPIVTPLYRWIDIPYVYTGLKLYDWIAGRRRIGRSRLVSAAKAKERFPMLRSNGLRGAVLYYDGQFDDARMNIAIVKTAVERRCAAINHTEVVELTKGADPKDFLAHSGGGGEGRGEGASSTEIGDQQTLTPSPSPQGRERGARLTGAILEDRITGKRITVRAKAILNATGPFTDTIRKLDNPDAKPMMRVSSGIHIIVDERFSPPDTGLLIPKTEDGRVLFLLPWLGQTLVGTTDNPAELATHPRVTDDEVEYLLRHLRQYFDVPLTRDDVKAVWSGLRPLVSDPAAHDTARLSRDHVIEVSPSGLITITGGKWTTYRHMAEETIDEAIRVGGFDQEDITAEYAESAEGDERDWNNGARSIQTQSNPSSSLRELSLSAMAGGESSRSRNIGPCITESLILAGGERYDPEGHHALMEHYKLEEDIARHLNHAFGDRAERIAELAEPEFRGRLVAQHPFIEAEVVYAVREELAVRIMDVLARRTRLAFLDRAAAEQALPRILEIMAAELGWDAERIAHERAEAHERLAQGL